MAKHEQTSKPIASLAGELLNGKKFSAAVVWLQDGADDPDVSEESRAHAAILLSTIAAMKRVAASALTQVAPRK